MKNQKSQKNYYFLSSIGLFLHSEYKNILFLFISSMFQQNDEFFYFVHSPLDICNEIQAKNKNTFTPGEIQAIQKGVQYDIKRGLKYSEEGIIALGHAFLRIQDEQKNQRKNIFQIIEGGKKD